MAANDMLPEADWPLAEDGPDELLTEADWAAIREGDAAIARGEFITLEDLKRELGL
ncbi:MAG: hypothetical protein ACR2NN_11000 [Bryobacteraceae bacterium]